MDEPRRPYEAPAIVKTESELLGAARRVAEARASADGVAGVFDWVDACDKLADAVARVDAGPESEGGPVIGMSRLTLDPDGHIEALASDLDFARRDANALRCLLASHADEMAQLRSKLRAWQAAAAGLLGALLPTAWHLIELIR